MTTESNEPSHDENQSPADEETNSNIEMPTNLTIEEQVMFLRDALDASRKELDQITA